MLRAGETVGPYTLVRELGRGAFGAVWLGERRSSLVTTQVALKLPLGVEPDLEAIAREAKVWVQASGHPNVLPVIEAEVYGSQVVIVSEFAAGGPLAALLKGHTDGIPPVEKSVEMARGILTGLTHLHSRGIIHRDVKPANVLLQCGTPRLTDFGLARVLKASGSSHAVAGTPAYMAPEAWDGSRSEQTDLWSVGVMLYEMVSGRLPFPQTEWAALFRAITSECPAPLPSTLPSGLVAVIQRSLHKDPGKRFLSAREMLSALTGVEQHLSGPRPPPDGVAGMGGEPTLSTLTPSPLPGGERELATPSRDQTPRRLNTAVEARRQRPAAALRLRVVTAAAVAGVLLAGVALFPARPGPSLKLLPLSPVSLRPGEGKRLTVRIERQNCSGPAEVRVEGLPDGVTCESTRVADGRQEAEVYLTAALDVAEGKTSARVLTSLGGRRAEGPFELTVERFLTNSLGMKLAFIPPGKFTMGSGPNEPGRQADERRREVEVPKPFYMGVYEVTQAEYLQIMQSNPSYFSPRGGGALTGLDTGRFPVDSVSYQMAIEFCRRLSDLPAERAAGRRYRLPLEEEWEYACRATTTSCFHTGDGLRAEEANVGRVRARTAAVGSYPVPNRFGLYDMHGNVMEWCQNPYEPDGRERVIRGGSWQDRPSDCRSAYREHSEPDKGRNTDGFRVLCEIQSGEAR